MADDPYATRVDIPKLEIASKGDETREKLHQAIGEAMAAWAILELHFAMEFYGFIGGNERARHAALRAFGAAEAFYVQRQMLQAVADVFFERHGDEEYLLDKKPTSHAKELRAYINRCVKLSEIRNKIAHSRVVRLLRKGRRRIHGWFLIPFEWDKNYTREGPSYALTSVELAAFAEACRLTPVHIEGMCELRRYVHGKTHRRRRKKSQRLQALGLGSSRRKPQ